MLTKIFLFSAILTISLVTSQQTFTHQFESSSCQFTYNCTDENCSDFKFIECQYEICEEIDEETLQCSKQKSYVRNKWDVCTNNCCKPNVTYQQNYSTLQQCQVVIDQTNKQNTKMILIIVGASVGGGILLGVIIFAISKGKCNCQNFECTTQYISTLISVALTLLICSICCFFCNLCCQPDQYRPQSQPAKQSSQTQKEKNQEIIVAQQSTQQMKNIQVDNIKIQLGNNQNLS